MNGALKDRQILDIDDGKAFQGKRTVLGSAIPSSWFVYHRDKKLVSECKASHCSLHRERLAIGQLALVGRR